MKHAADRAVELALGQALAPGPSGPTPVCPDEGIVAAWTEGGLSPAERVGIEDHFATCGYCQAILVGLAKSAPADFASAGRGQARAWTRWTWPLSAAAALLLAVGVGVLVSRRDGGSAPTLESVQSRASETDPVDGAGRAAAPAATVAVPEGTAPRSGGEPARFRDEVSKSTSSPVRAEPTAGQAPAAAAAEAPGDVAASPSTGERPAEAKVENAAPAPAAPPAPVDTRQDSAAQSLAEGRAREDRPAARVLGAAPQSAAALARRGLTIDAPTGAARWRVGAQVEWTEDGVSWRASDVTPPVASAIMAGHSPGGSTCWLVGRGGLVLLTTDGLRFERVGAPTSDELAFVRANDADIAEVGTADGRRWRTTNRGRSWAAVSR